jgi:dTDP-4-dehydrorhamnose reductase
VNIFIAGSNGQLARDCRVVLSRQHEVAGLDMPDLDITDESSVARAMARFRPDVVINCAAYTRVDDCESQKEDAWRVNALGPQLLAEACAASGILLVHISTDYVFDGEKPVPQVYVEDDPVNPLSVYGASKLAGERAVCALSPRHIVMRTAWMYGMGGRNFLKTILRRAVQQPGRGLRVVNDQHGSPTWSWRLAEQTAHLIQNDAQGVYHAAGLGGCTWFEFASCFLDRLGAQHSIEPCTMAEYPLPARRPKNSVLEVAHLKDAGLCVMRPWQEDVETFALRHRDVLLAEAAANG